MLTSDLRPWGPLVPDVVPPESRVLSRRPFARNISLCHPMDASAKEDRSRRMWKRWQLLVLWAQTWNVNGCIPKRTSSNQLECGPRDSPASKSPDLGVLPRSGDAWVNTFRSRTTCLGAPGRTTRSKVRYERGEPGANLASLRPERSDAFSKRLQFALPALRPEAQVWCSCWDGYFAGGQALRLLQGVAGVAFTAL